MCGKNLSETITELEPSGSPPRVREKLCKKFKIYFKTRITPACAGKTLSKLVHIPRYRDHPRVCGKNVKYINDDMFVSGSPPRVREKPCGVTSLILSNGITPACAGKTSHRTSHNRLYWDHPRVCGKNDCFRNCFVVV